MKIAVVTTFHEKGLKDYGQKMIDSFCKNWPEEVTLHIYPEQCNPAISNHNQVHSVAIKCNQLKSSAIKCNQLHSPAKPQGLSTAARRAYRAGIEAQPSLLGNPSVDPPWFERRAERQADHA